MRDTADTDFFLKGFLGFGRGVHINPPPLAEMKKEGWESGGARERERKMDWKTERVWAAEKKWRGVMSDETERNIEKGAKREREREMKEWEGNEGVEGVKIERER